MTQSRECVFCPCIFSVPFSFSLHTRFRLFARSPRGTVASISLPHASLNAAASLPLGRLELQHGLGLPVPQLEGVRGGVRAAVRLRSGGAHFYAREPSLLPGGKRHAHTHARTSSVAPPFSLLMVAIMTSAGIRVQGKKKEPASVHVSSLP